ncbi:MAG TPA: Cu(I)-responsive transcriptional regulator [Acetobacteraceae bacterium]|nr:Cu(I)-responsive transcriptional regulator [Acetobacteraceae bacterium]
MNAEPLVTIRRAAEASGVSAKMIRHYEQIGLIRPPVRSEAGYRFYAGADVQTLAFVHRARALGFSLDEIRRLLALWQDRDRPSAEVKALALRHVAALEAKAALLQDMGRTLRHLATHCHGDHRPECPIIDALAGAEGAHPDAAHLDGAEQIGE